MNSHKFQRLLCCVAGVSALSTVVLVFAAFASGSTTQKDKFADFAAATGVLFSTSAVVAIEISDSDFHK